MQNKNLIYLIDASNNVVCCLNGVQYDSVSYSENLMEYDTLSFTVDEYIDIDGVKVKSAGYDGLHEMMYIYLSGIQARNGIKKGLFRISSEPDVSNDGYNESKSVNCDSAECELNNQSFSLKINTGEYDSAEYLADGNVDTVTGLAKEYVTIYNEDNPSLSLLDLALEEIPYWSVGYVDPLIKDKKYTFGGDPTPIYSFLMNNLASLAQVVFLFDTVDRKVNVYSIERMDEIGETNIFVSYRNLLETVDISPSNDGIYTRFNVEGADGLSIASVNFNESRIENLLHLLNTVDEKGEYIYVSADTVSKYQKWYDYRYGLNGKRQEFVDLSRSYNEYIISISELQSRLPTDALDYSQYDNMDEETLNSLLNQYIILANGLVTDYAEKDKDGNVVTDSDGLAVIADESGLINSIYWQDYNIYVNSIIPNIRIAIQNLSLIDDDKIDYINTYETDWNLYGSTELSNKLSSYKANMEALTSSGYEKDWEDLTEEEQSRWIQSTYEIYHSQYILYANQYSVCYIALHGSNHDEREILPETALIFSDRENAFLIFTMLDLTPWQEYNVTFNGTDYVCTAVEITDDDGTTGIVMGNIAIVGLDEGGNANAPFVLVYSPVAYSDMGYNGMLAAIDESKDVTLAIRLGSEIVNNADYGATLYQDIDGYYIQRSNGTQYYFDSDWNQIEISPLRSGTKLLGRLEEIDVAKSEQADVKSKIDELLIDVAKTNEKFGFTEDELFALSKLTKDSDYVNENILTTSIDNIVTQIDQSEELFKAAVDQLDIESQPQYSFTATLDNLFNIEEFKMWRGDFICGNFIRVGLTDDSHIKLRVLSISYNPCVIDGKELSITFSNMIRGKSGLSDYMNLFNSAITSSINQITASYAKNVDVSALYINDNALRAIANSDIFNSAVSDIVNNSMISNDGIFNTITSKYISTEEFEARLARIQTLEADSAFVKYLESNLIVAGEINTDTLIASMAQIDVAKIGDVFTNTLTSLISTTAKTTIDDAYIQSAIVNKLYVGDLLGGTISTNKFTIQSDDGAIFIKDSTQYWCDKNGNVRIQAGLDTTGNFTFSIFDETGVGVLIDSTGIKDKAVSDELVVERMLSSDSVSTSKIQNAAITSGKIDWSSFSLYVNQHGSEVIDISEFIVSESGMSYKLGTMITKVDALEQRTNITVKIEASSVLFNEEEITLTAHVYNYETDVTDQVPAANFVWKRITGNSDEDVQWNAIHTGMKEIVITSIDDTTSFQLDVNTDNIIF